MNFSELCLYRVHVLYEQSSYVPIFNTKAEIILSESIYKEVLVAIYGAFFATCGAFVAMKMANEAMIDGAAK
jgi:hypothetical protein